LSVQQFPQVEVETISEDPALAMATKSAESFGKLDRCGTNFPQYYKSIAMPGSLCFMHNLSRWNNQTVINRPRHAKREKLPTAFFLQLPFFAGVCSECATWVGHEKHNVTYEQEAKTDIIHVLPDLIQTFKGTDLLRLAIFCGLTCWQPVCIPRLFLCRRSAWFCRRV